jgi:hypothetical protein
LVDGYDGALFNRAYIPRFGCRLGGTPLPDENQREQVQEARDLLESVALLEKVAASREAKAEKIMDSLESGGMSPEQMAEDLDISNQSTETLLARDEPKPPHERAGISDQSIEKLDPQIERSEAV